MLPVQIEEKLQMFRDEKYIFLNPEEQTVLEEKKKDGRVKLTFTAQAETLILPSPENNVLPYLDDQKKGARACADVFVYTHEVETKTWDLHIIEFKKTINTDSIGKSRWQFTMGIYNARAVAAFLGMEIKNTYLYSGFRNDKITFMENASLIGLRASNNTEALGKIKQWKNGNCKLKIDGKDVEFSHKKIYLTQEGNGKLSI